MSAPQIKFLIVTHKPALFDVRPDILVLTPHDFIGLEHIKQFPKKLPKVINLTNNYDYLSEGYYVSLLGEARSMQCIPSVNTIIALNWKRNYDFALAELNALLAKHYKEPLIEPSLRRYASYFGRHDDPGLEMVTRRIFDLFRFPVISLDIKSGSNGKWVIDKIDTPSFSSLSDAQLGQFQKALSTFTGSAWRLGSKNKKQERYWIAILHDPEEQHAPSNKAALKKFVSVGKKMGLWVELITKNDFSSLLEFDALLIRSTTAINNYTYRFANKAEQEDIPCIDDTTSIIRCCNKVYLKEILAAKNIPMPKTVILEKRHQADIHDSVGFPAVLKIPDGSFSRGISKVTDLESLRATAAKMFVKSDIILLQEFLPSEFDWRIGVLNNEPLFANKYYMADGHWQIYNHGAAKKRKQYGAHAAIALEDVPKAVMDITLEAAQQIGSGLYGVDLKQLPDGRVVVIEINDNPNIDCGVEDMLLGDALYQKVLQHLVRLIEA